MRAENRLHRLMTARAGIDKTFDEHLAKVRARIEKDGIRTQKLGEKLLILEGREMESTAKSQCIHFIICTIRNMPVIVKVVSRNGLYILQDNEKTLETVLRKDKTSHRRFGYNADI